jgi:hypothetical protein
VVSVAEGGGEAAGIGGRESNDDVTKAGISGHATGERAITISSEWAVTPPRRCALMVAGTVSASAAGAVRQHEAASSETGAAGESMAHASQDAVAGGSPDEVVGIVMVIVIGQPSRSPARGAAPVTTRERSRRRHNVRRIMILE